MNWYHVIILYQVAKHRHRHKRKMIMISITIIKIYEKKQDYRI